MGTLAYTIFAASCESIIIFKLKVKKKLTTTKLQPQSECQQPMESVK